MILHQTSNSVGCYSHNTYIYNNRFFAAHFHGNYELIYTIIGKTEVTVNGVFETLGAGDFLLISPYSVHSLNIPENTRAHVSVFSRDYILDFAAKYMFCDFSKFECEKTVKDFLTDNFFYSENPEHYLLTACFNLVCSQCVKNSRERRQDNSTDFIKNVTIYIGENLENNISMAETAAALNYEYHYFSALFNKHFSMSFKKFINALRFEYACDLLIREAASITEICGKCGFGSLRSFNRVFKSLSGMTPNEYRYKKTKGDGDIYA